MDSGGTTWKIDSGSKSSSDIKNSKFELVPGLADAAY